MMRLSFLLRSVGIITLSLSLLAVLTDTSAGQASRRKPRVLVLTDISSLTAGEREPDDGQSLIRLLLYANDLDIEGLIASANLGHGQITRPELIREALAAYAKVRPNLLLHDRTYPPVEKLLMGVKAGQPKADRNVPVMESIGAGKDTEASDWIIQVTDRRDARPLWVTVWGGTADLAQALWKVRETRTTAEQRKFVAKLRIHAIGDQDSTGPWIRENFPDLFYITRRFGYRGIYRGGDISLASPEWVETHIRNGHGALGALYPNYNGGDIWGRELGPVRGIKEGDTPSFLALLPNGLDTPDEPTWGGWGGRFVRENNDPNRYTDIADLKPAPTDPDPRISAVYRWRPAIQSDFQARLDWCVKSRKEANHAPTARIAGPQRRTVYYGEKVTLEARASDPDGDRLTYRWTVYQEPGDFRDKLTLSGETTSRLSFTAPDVSAPKTLHLLLTVQDNGEPSLSGYARVVITLRPIR